MNDELLRTFRKIILLNEGDPNDPDYWLKFTDPDGIHSGKSGWSFGECQFDLNNNEIASICLKECGFTEKEIDSLKDQTIDVHPLEPRLKEHSDIIVRYDEHQLVGCLIRANNTCSLFHVEPEDDAAILAVADYDNQYHFSGINKPHSLVNYLVNLKVPFTANDILMFKLTDTKYGREHPQDCQRRYDNIMKVMQDGV
jgi:hypothetical protein